MNISICLMLNHLDHKFLEFATFDRSKPRDIC